MTPSRRFGLSCWLAGALLVGGLAPAQASVFRRGDANTDGDVNLSDGIRILDFLFLGDWDLPCSDAGDADDDGVVNLGDSVHLFAFLFRGGRAPPAPGPLACGVDPTQDSLDCAS